MIRHIKIIKSKVAESEQCIFYIVSILFAVILLFAVPAVDDIGAMRVKGGNIGSYWERSLELYRLWSSRIIVNFILFFFTDHSNYYWAIFMGFSMFIMLKAISLLVEGDCKEINQLVVCGVMLYPFRDMRTAGWIATSMTYFCPTAFGLMALVPIKKIMSQEKIKVWEYIAYVCCLIYGANNEQMMVVILACYIVSAICFVIRGCGNGYHFLLLLLAVGSCIITLLCPGNYARIHDEIINWYPTYGMLNMIDKAELGYTTTLRWLFFESNLYIIFICALFYLLIWKRYRSLFFRIIAGVPLCATVFCGPLKGIVGTVFPSIMHLADEISDYGLVTPENRGDIAAFGQFFCMSVILLALCLEVVLLQNSWKEISVCFTVLASGAASRMYMGFSPTIFASCYRTCEVMSFCIIIVGIGTYVNNREYLSIYVRKKLKYIANTLVVLSFLDLWFLVGTAFK